MARSRSWVAGSVAAGLVALPPFLAAWTPDPLLDLQSQRVSATIEIEDLAGAPGKATLVNLNPRINAWFLLRLLGPEGRAAVAHLENADPRGQRLRLDPGFKAGLVIESLGERHLCELWAPASGAGTPLEAARRDGRSYSPLCGERLYLRNPTQGRKTYTEWVTDFLRDHVWHGERIVGFVRDAFYADANLRSSDTSPALEPPALEPGFPAPALVAAGSKGRQLLAPGLGLGVEGCRDDRLAAGRWYPLQANPGAFLSVIRPDLVSSDVITSQLGLVSPLDPVESEALVYLVAFDLGRFELGFELGTDHPRVDWSPAVLEAVRDARPGPDGFDSTSPLVRTGMLNPAEAARVAATFTGGFKRAHGAFRWGDFARVNHGSHYGFVQSGVVLSTLQPGLATVVVWEDGTLSLETWSRRADAELPRVRHARQNGVPLVEDASGTPRVGPLVRSWGAGNWSGSPDARLRTLRAGLCLQEADGRRFLSYGYFTSATPSAMARVFQAYGCRYAMLLDMNALEHTYLAVYEVRDGEILTRHLVDGMSVLDMSNGTGRLPRFVGFADNRDFFYLLRRRQP